MVDPVQELKTRAELLQRRLAAGSEPARERLRVLPELTRADAAALAAAAPRIQRKHCLGVVAREHGFTTWEQARRVLDGGAGEADFGTLLYGASANGALNVWFTEYDEARRYLDESRRAGARWYLLAYRRQLFVAERGFVRSLGLDPDDADWEAIDFDWARPRDPHARWRLYAKLLETTRREP
jgi:hypothetical protein